MTHLRPRRRRLLILESLSTIAGGQQVLLDAVPALNAAFELTVLLPDDGPLARRLRAGGVSCRLAPVGQYTLVRKTVRDALSYAARVPLMTLLTWRLIRQAGIDLVYANSGRTFVWGTLAAALSGRPMVWHHHNLLADAKTLALVRLVGRLGTVRRILCASEVACQQFPALAHKAVVIPSGVDTERFRPARAWGAAVREELGIADDSRVVGMVGDLILLKGQHSLLEALSLVPPGVGCVIVGAVRPGDAESQAYASRLRQMAPDNVVFTGRRPDLPAVLNALDLLVVASERETGPLVLLEALACGVPVISTPVGRAPDLLLPEALYPVNDAAALASRIEFWLSDRQRLEAARLAARALAEERLTLDRFRAALSAEIERTLGRSA